jgi:hypothetical protein
VVRPRVFPQQIVTPASSRRAIGLQRKALKALISQSSEQAAAAMVAAYAPHKVWYEAAGYDVPVRLP